MADNAARCPTAHFAHDDLRPFDNSWIDRAVFDRFELVADWAPAKIALDDGLLRLTYREVQQAARHLARRIEAAVPVGRPIGVFLPNGALFPIAALACLATNRLFVPIDQSYPSERNRQIASEAGLAAVIHNDSDGTTQALFGAIVQLDLTHSLSQPSDRIPAGPVNGPAAVLYTSGSTGRPKGICIDQRAISQRVAQFTTTGGFNSEDRFVLLSSPGTIAGIRDTFVALLNGATLCIADPYQLGAKGILDVIRDQRITVCYAVPALLRELLRQPMAKHSFGNLRLIRFGGDSVLASDIELCRASLPESCEILIGFGSTEVPTIFQWTVPADWAPDGPTVPCGFPQADISISLQTETGSPAAAGEVGEVVVRSRYVALGLWQHGHLSSGSIELDPQDPAVRIMRTADLVRVRDDGMVQLIGRKDRQLKIRGFRIDPGDIEFILRRCDEVTDVVVTTETQGATEIIVAYAAARVADSAPILQRLRRAAATLPRHMRPSRIHLVDEIPRLPSFKPDIKRLQARGDFAGLESRRLRSKRSPATDREIKMLSICRQVLKQDNLSLADNFFDAGGNSLLAMVLMLEIETQLGLAISLDTIFDSGSIADLCVAVGESNEAPLTVVLPVKSRPNQRTLYFVHTGFEFSALSEALTSDLSTAFITINGARALRRFLDNKDALAAIDRISSEYAQAIFARNQTEPCCLAGHSFGGILAVETASKLEQLGAAPGVLFLFDTYLHGAVRRILYDIRYNGWLGRKLEEAARGNHRKIARRARSLARDTLHRLTNFEVFEKRSEIIEKSEASPETVISSLLLDLRDEGSQAYAGPKRRLESHTVLFRATRSLAGNVIRVNSDLGWARKLGANLTVVTTPGNHLSLLSREYVGHVAGEIDRQIASRMGAAATDSRAEDARRSLP